MQEHLCSTDVLKCYELLLEFPSIACRHFENTYSLSSYSLAARMSLLIVLSRDIRSASSIPTKQCDCSLERDYHCCSYFLSVWCYRCLSSKVHRKEGKQGLWVLGTSNANLGLWPLPFACKLFPFDTINLSSHS
ncbi:Hypothetical predicted protein [Podarcis lilfordi]|uniref:Uncharacterized protein n=1 Tax=Podarcis lilfordi TaxID=74358 RepID=A0AA35P4T6_9SAUR|nr:Hypothetical predicted protein [Podarcis lilfordi]